MANSVTKGNHRTKTIPPLAQLSDQALRKLLMLSTFFDGPVLGDTCQLFKKKQVWHKDIAGVPYTL